MKQFKVGMYGGKFMPLHRGHDYCIEVAARECETLYIIMFYGGDEEEAILQDYHEDFLKLEARVAQLKKVASKYDNVKYAVIDVTNLKNENGREDWDAETPLVRAIVGDHLDAVYSSEFAYGEYYKRAYPEAVHRVVDSGRSVCPISGTAIRRMRSKEREKWII